MPWGNVAVLYLLRYTSQHLRVKSNNIYHIASISLRVHVLLICVCAVSNCSSQQREDDSWLLCILHLQHWHKLGQASATVKEQRIWSSPHCQHSSTCQCQRCVQGMRRGVIGLLDIFIMCYRYWNRLNVQIQIYRELWAVTVAPVN